MKIMGSAKEWGRSWGSHTSAVHDLSVLRCEAASTFRRTVVASTSRSRRLFLHCFHTEADGTTVLRNVGYSLKDNLYPPSGPHRACNGNTLPLPLLTQRQGVICQKAWTVTANNFRILLNCFHKPVAVIQAWWLVCQYITRPKTTLPQSHIQPAWNVHVAAKDVPTPRTRSGYPKLSNEHYPHLVFFTAVEVYNIHMYFKLKALYP